MLLAEEIEYVNCAEMGEWLGSGSGFTWRMCTVTLSSKMSSKQLCACICHSLILIELQESEL